MSKAKLARAVRQFADFHGHEPRRVFQVDPVVTEGDTLWSLGRARAIEYDWHGETYRHEFGREVFVATTTGGRVLIVSGGELEVTPAGIEG